MESEKIAKAERERLMALLSDYGINEKKIKVLEPVIENTAWMKAKLDAARALVSRSNVAINYDNGGGQKGIRENPAYKGYEALWKSYMLGYTKILEALPPEEAKAKADEVERPKTVLEIVRAKHGKEA